MQQFTIQSIRKAVEELQSTMIPQEDILVSQEIYDKLKSGATEIVEFHGYGIPVRIDPKLKGNEWRLDDSKIKPSYFDGPEIWTWADEMGMWR